MIRQENIARYANGNCQLSIVNCQLIKYSAFGENIIDTNKIDNWKWKIENEKSGKYSKIYQR